MYYRKKQVKNGQSYVKIIKCILFEGQVFCPGKNKKAKIPVRIIKKQFEEEMDRKLMFGSQDDDDKSYKKKKTKV